MPKQSLVFAACIALIIAFSSSSICSAASPEGSWRGKWNSQSTGHQGALRARIRPINSTTYRAVFFGRFAGVVPFVYPAKLERAAGSCDRYTSSQRLPLLGTYRMTATVNDHRFFATFSGKKDVGTFDMSR